jgi:hypothetical protein
MKSERRHMLGWRSCSKSTDACGDEMKVGRHFGSSMSEDAFDKPTRQSSSAMTLSILATNPLDMSRKTVGETSRSDHSLDSFQPHHSVLVKFCHKVLEECLVCGRLGLLSFLHLPDNGRGFWSDVTAELLSESARSAALRPVWRPPYLVGCRLRPVSRYFLRRRDL